MTTDVRTALEEIRRVVARSGQKNSLLQEIDEALASGEEAKMKTAIAHFDSQDTLVIERIRKKAEDRSSE